VVGGGIRGLEMIRALCEWVALDKVDGSADDDGCNSYVDEEGGRLYDDDDDDDDDDDGGMRRA